MRSSLIPLAVVISTLFLGLIPTAVKAEEAADMRPALIGSGPNSFINRVNTNALIKKGQGNAAILFYCTVGSDGSPGIFQAYSGTPDSEKLRQELRNCFRSSKFIPAVYRHQRLPALMFGTATFMNINGKPRLRIFANQETDDLKKESDFISPQPIFPRGHTYHSVPDPSTWWSSDVPGMVELSLVIDATGKLNDIHLVKEAPTGKRYGETALNRVKQLAFMPAFRNGKPVDSTTHYTFYFVVDGKMKLSVVALPTTPAG